MGDEDAGGDLFAGEANTGKNTKKSKRDKDKKKRKKDKKSRKNKGGNDDV